jgi:4-oxalocrotonate tautomerase
MPVITVQWLEGRTHEQKAKLADQLTRAFVEVAGVQADQVWIVFEDSKRANWAMGGKLLGGPG